MTTDELIPVEDLTDEELQLLIGLLMVAVHADLEYTPEETAGLIEIGERVGRQRFVNASVALRQRLPTKEAILAAVPSVERRPARTLIYHMVEQICAVDGINRGEEPPQPSTAPYRQEASRLPGSLEESVAALRRNEVLNQALGRQFVDYFATIKESEIARFREAVTPWEHYEYFSAL